VLLSFNCTQPFPVAVNDAESNPAIPFVVAPSVAPAAAILCPDCTTV
jgi:hypothetical protein